MDKPISVGDLVMVVKLMPCGHGKPGAIFRVQTIEDPLGLQPNWCVHCKTVFADRSPLAIGDGQTVGFFRLKRIPPLDELEGVKEREELTA